VAVSPVDLHGCLFRSHRDVGSPSC
jgi:hypothetical protein